MSPVVKKKRKKITITSQQLLLVLTAVCAFLLIFTFNTNVFEGVLKQAAGYVVVPFQNGIATIGGYLADRSDELAQFLADRANSGAGDVAFVIGSSHGLSDEVKKAAALKFSMGRITMPHQLARLVLTEQIYRACTINAGMKYHK